MIVDHKSDTEIVAVIQADRDAAADLVRWQRQATGEWKSAEGGDVWQFFVAGFSRGIRQGIWDEHEVVQAFARHRLQSPPDTELLEKRLRELTKIIVQHLGGGSEWFSRIGDDFYADPEPVRAELQRRKTDAQITKRALVQANRSDTELRKALERTSRVLHDYITASGDWDEDDKALFADIRAALSPEPSSDPFSIGGR